MSQPKGSLFLNSKKNPAHDSVIERDSTPQKFRDQVSATFHLWLPRRPRWAADVQLTVEGREKGGSLWEFREPVMEVVCISSAHILPLTITHLQGLSYVQGKFKTYMPMGKVQWTPAESQNTSSFQLADTCSLSLHKIKYIQPYIVLGKQLLTQ